MEPPHSRSSHRLAVFVGGRAHGGVELGDDLLDRLGGLRLVPDEGDEHVPRVLVDGDDGVLELPAQRGREGALEVDVQVAGLRRRGVKLARVRRLADARGSAVHRGHVGRRGDVLGRVGGDIRQLADLGRTEHAAAVDQLPRLRRREASNVRYRFWRMESEEGALVARARVGAAGTVEQLLLAHEHERAQLELLVVRQAVAARLGGKLQVVQVAEARVDALLLPELRDRE